MRFIICCKCNGVPKFAADAFALKFPNEPAPRIVTQPDFHKFIGEIKRGSQLAQKVQELMNNKDRFAYLFDVDDKYRVVERYDLLTGRKMQ